jgi:prolyl-tRNA synthetase
VDTWDEFKAALDAGGFVEAHWDGSSETEELIKQETKATIRCIPLEGDDESGACIRTGAPSERRVVFARAY